jgi:hypothetical protein
MAETRFDWESQALSPAEFESSKSKNATNKPGPTPANTQEYPGVINNIPNDDADGNQKNV